MTMLNSLLASKDDEVHQPLELEAVEGGSENNRAGGRMGILILSENSSEEAWHDNSALLANTVSGLWETCLDLTEEEWIHLNQRSPWLGNRCYRSHQ